MNSDNNRGEDFFFSEFSNEGIFIYYNEITRCPFDRIYGEISSSFFENIVKRI